MKTSSICLGSQGKSLLIVLLSLIFTKLNKVPSTILGFVVCFLILSLGLPRNPLSGFFHLAGMMFVFYAVAQNIRSLRATGLSNIQFHLPKHPTHQSFFSINDHSTLTHQLLFLTLCIILNFFCFSIDLSRSSGRCRKPYSHWRFFFLLIFSPLFSSTKLSPFFLSSFLLPSFLSFFPENVLEVIPALLSLVAFSYLAPLLQYFMSKVFSFSILSSFLSHSHTISPIGTPNWSCDFLSSYHSNCYLLGCLLVFVGQRGLFSPLLPSFSFYYDHSFYYYLFIYLFIYYKRIGPFPKLPSSFSRCFAFPSKFTHILM